MSYDPYQPGVPRMPPPAPQPPPRRKMRKGLRITLWSVGGLAVLFVIAAVAGSHEKTPRPAASGGGTVTPAAAATTAPASPAAPPHVLLAFSGSGIKNSAPFLVPGQVTVKYTYNCASTGSQGNFVADLLYGNQSSLSSDDQTIANALGTGGTQTTTVYPQDPGKDYYLAVNSECAWSVTVTGP